MKLNLEQLLLLQGLITDLKWDEISFENENHILKEIDKEIEEIKLDAKACGEYEEYHNNI